MSANGSLSSMSANGNGGLSAMSAGNSLTTASAGNYTISAMSSGSATTCYKRTCPTDYYQEKPDGSVFVYDEATSSGNYQITGCFHVKSCAPGYTEIDNGTTPITYEPQNFSCYKSSEYYLTINVWVDTPLQFDTETTLISSDSFGIIGHKDYTAIPDGYETMEEYDDFYDKLSTIFNTSATFIDLSLNGETMSIQKAKYIYETSGYETISEDSVSVNETPQLNPWGDKAYLYTYTFKLTDQEGTVVEFVNDNLDATKYMTDGLEKSAIRPSVFAEAEYTIQPGTEARIDLYYEAPKPEYFVIEEKTLDDRRNGGIIEHVYIDFKLEDAEYNTINKNVFRIVGFALEDRELLFFKRNNSKTDIVLSGTYQTATCNNTTARVDYGSIGINAHEAVVLDTEYNDNCYAEPGGTSERACVVKRAYASGIGNYVLYFSHDSFIDQMYCETPQCGSGNSWTIGCNKWHTNSIVLTYSLKGINLEQAKLIEVDRGLSEIAGNKINVCITALGDGIDGYPYYNSKEKNYICKELPIIYRKKKI